MNWRKEAEPTDSVSSMVTVVNNNKLRICSDPKDLNKDIRREHYPFSTLEEMVSSMSGTKVFFQRSTQNLDFCKLSSTTSPVC